MHALYKRGTIGKQSGHCKEEKESMMHVYCPFKPFFTLLYLEFLDCMRKVINHREWYCAYIYIYIYIYGEFLYETALF